MPGAHRRLRSQGAVAARGDHAESEGARTARALDAERKAKGPRSPLHGIPVVLKDNYDTVDMPTTGGSVLLEGSMPPDDAFVVKKLRDCRRDHPREGEHVRVRVGRRRYSSLGGQIAESARPRAHAVGIVRRHRRRDRGGVRADRAWAPTPADRFADPPTSNGIAGLKPTHGLLSRDGIIPLALSFDTGGPMARSVSDVAAALGVMTGVDPADAATKKSEGKLRDRLHEGAEGRRAEGRAHRRRARLPRRRSPTSTG